MLRSVEERLQFKLYMISKMLIQESVLARKKESPAMKGVLFLCSRRRLNSVLKDEKSGGRSTATVPSAVFVFFTFFINV